VSDPAVLTRQQMREVDRRAIQDYGIPSLELMESAGRSCADEALALLEPGSSPVLVLCGPGNNGGDGFVLARTLFEKGVAVRVLGVGASGAFQGASADVQQNIRRWEGLGQAIQWAGDDAAVDALSDGFREAGLLVDALFGTGLARALRSPFDRVVRGIAEAKRPVLAIDLPSGLDADTGQVLGSAAAADVTVTLAAYKLGMTLARGPALCGRVTVAPIGIPPGLIGLVAGR